MDSIMLILYHFSDFYYLSCGTFNKKDYRGRHIQKYYPNLSKKKHSGLLRYKINRKALKKADVGKTRS